MARKSFLDSRTAGVMFMLINVLFWGAALPVVKPALDVTTPFQVLLYRYVIAAIITLPILGWYAWRKRHLFKKIPLIIGIELFGTVGANALIYHGLARTSAIEASLLANTTPFFIVLGGIIFLSEKQERHEWLGLGIAMLGATFLTIEPILNGNSIGQISFLGNLFVIGHNFSVATAFLMAKRHYQKLPKFFVTSISYYVGIVSFFFLAMLQTGLNPGELVQTAYAQLQISSVALASVYLALFGSVIGLTAYILGQSRMEASEASLFTYLQPLVYVPLAIYYLREPATPAVLVALTLIVTGVLIGEMRWRRRGWRTVLLGKKWR